jgi:hypothetical protein
MTWNDVISTFGRRDVLLIVGLAFVSVLLWNIPLIKLFFYPFRVLNVFVHELSHGFAAAMSGGRFDRFVVNPEISGAAYRYGGAHLIVAPAGYLGAALFGAFLILLSATSISARAILMGMSILLALACLFFVANCFGYVAGWGLSALLFYVGWQLDDSGAAAVLLFLAVQLILASFESLFVLLDLSRRGRGRGSDAEKMEAITGIPAASWALLWCFAAVAILVWSITVAYRDLPLR